MKYKHIDLYRTLLFVLLELDLTSLSSHRNVAELIWKMRGGKRLRGLRGYRTKEALWDSKGIK